jgi:hypothetical protein
MPVARVSVDVGRDRPPRIALPDLPTQSVPNQPQDNTHKIINYNRVSFFSTTTTRYTPFFLEAR